MPRFKSSCRHLSLSTPDGRLSSFRHRPGILRRANRPRRPQWRRKIHAARARSRGASFPRRDAFSSTEPFGLLRQDVQLAAGATVVDLFGARRALELLRRAERGDVLGRRHRRRSIGLLEARLAWPRLPASGSISSPDTEAIAARRAARSRGFVSLRWSSPSRTSCLLDEPTTISTRTGARP